MGIFTGLVPGIHANTIAMIAVSFSFGNPICFGIFVVSMSTTHSFVDAIPNIFLGAASEDSFLSILPGHEMLLNGKGFEAIMLTVTGGIIAIIAALFLAPFLLSAIINYSEIIPYLIPAILIITLTIMIFSEEKKQKTILVILLSGILGIITLNLGIANSIIALVTGFFAFPSLFQSLIKNTKVPEQIISFESQKIRGGIFAAFISTIISVFPGIGPSHAAFVAGKLIRTEKKEYLSMIGGINSANLLFSLIVFYILGKTRTGMTAALTQITKIEINAFLIFGAALIGSAGIAAIVTEKLAKKYAKKINKINYKKINLIVIFALVLIVFWFSGIIGLIASASAASITSFSIDNKIRRSNSMSFLMFPTLLYYLGIGF